MRPIVVAILAIDFGGSARKSRLSIEPAATRYALMSWTGARRAKMAAQ